MTKRAAKEPQTRIQVRLSEELGEKVRSRARSMGISDSALGAVLISMGMHALEGHLDISGEVQRLDREGAQRREEQAAEDRPGFRPGGKARAELATVDDQHELVEQPRGTHGEQWTGYMARL